MAQQVVRGAAMEIGVRGAERATNHSLRQPCMRHWKRRAPGSKPYISGQWPLNGRVLLLPKHNVWWRAAVRMRAPRTQATVRRPQHDNRKAGDDGAVPTWDVAAQKLLTLIETKHQLTKHCLCTV